MKNIYLLHSEIVEEIESHFLKKSNVAICIDGHGLFSQKWKAKKDFHFVLLIKHRAPQLLYDPLKILFVTYFEVFSCNMEIVFVRCLSDCDRIGIK